MKISLLHATRNRPAQANQAKSKWLSLAQSPADIEHIFAVDPDDVTWTDLDQSSQIVTTCRPNMGCVAAWNLAALWSSGEILVQMSDDWTPPLFWDRIILSRMDTMQSQVLAISDGHRTDHLLCMAIITRQRYREQGYTMFHPRYRGVFSDDHLTAMAYGQGRVVEARDVVFVHDHPLWTGGMLDDTYRRQNAPERYREGQRVFASLVPPEYQHWPHKPLPQPTLDLRYDAVQDVQTSVLAD